jgi:glycosyltransferase involved in cell wall biosynthesis
LKGKLDISKSKILFLVTEDWYFWSHRLALARSIREKGFEVLVATRVQNYKALIEGENFKLYPIRLKRRNNSLFRELSSIIEIIKIYRKEKPDLAHHVAVKPIIYGSLAARVAGVTGVINTLSGLGFIFTSQARRTKILRRIVTFLYNHIAFSIENSFAIFQNPEDMNEFVEEGVVAKRKAVLIRGSGVDPSVFINTPEPKDIPFVVFASRMIKNKGIEDLVAAARLLKQNNIICRILLIGVPDEENPLSIGERMLRKWNSEGIIEWRGYVKNMPKILSEANIVVLPTYREGVPKILIEAAACGRAIIATDVPGCREIVRHKENGLLVPIQSPVALAKAIKFLIENPEVRKKMGAKGREIVERQFSDKVIIKQTISLYERLLNKQINSVSDKMS